MPKRLSFNGVEIPVAVYRGEYFFLRKEVSAAIGYSTSITLPEGCQVIELGANTYVSLKDLRKVFESATGERLGRAAEFLHRVHEVYGIPEDSDEELPIDEWTREWLLARAEIKAAMELWDQADEREARAWQKLTEMRHASAMKGDDHD